MNETQASMPTVKVGSRFRCERCGSEIVVVKAPAAPVRCCGDEMQRLQ